MTKFLAFLLLFTNACASMGFQFVREGLKKSVTPVAVLVAGSLMNIGTAFAVTPDLVATAAHVCDSDRPMFIKTFPAEIEALDRGEDLCLLRVNSHGLRVMQLRRYAPEFGEHLYVFGGPIGKPNILTEGYASDRVWLPLGEYSGYRVKMSVPAFGGNSGGPVLDDNGRVVGVLVAGFRQYPILTYSARIEKLREMVWASTKD